MKISCQMKFLPSMTVYSGDLYLTQNPFLRITLGRRFELLEDFIE